MSDNAALNNTIDTNALTTTTSKKNTFTVFIVFFIVLFIISIVLTILVGVKGVIWRNYTEDDNLFRNLDTIKSQNVPLYRLSVLGIIGLCLLWVGTLCLGGGSLYTGIKWRKSK